MAHKTTIKQTIFFGEELFLVTKKRKILIISCTAIFVLLFCFFSFPHLIKKGIIEDDLKIRLTENVRISEYNRNSQYYYARIEGDETAYTYFKTRIEKQAIFILSDCDYVSDQMRTAGVTLKLSDVSKETLAYQAANIGSSPKMNIIMSVDTNDKFVLHLFSYEQ